MRIWVEILRCYPRKSGWRMEHRIGRIRKTRPKPGTGGYWVRIRVYAPRIEVDVDVD